MSDDAGGPFERTGNSDTSQRDGSVGEWSMGNTGLRDGFFFAQAARTDRCRADRSRIIELRNGVQQ
jgi:hypothetical protein